MRYRLDVVKHGDEENSEGGLSPVRPIGRHGSARAATIRVGVLVSGAARRAHPEERGSW